MNERCVSTYLGLRCERPHGHRRDKAPGEHVTHDEFCVAADHAWNGHCLLTAMFSTKRCGFRAGNGAHCTQTVTHPIGTHCHGDHRFDAVADAAQERLSSEHADLCHSLGAP